LSTSILVFVVEDEAVSRTVLETALQDAGYAVVAAATAKEAASMLDEKRPAYRALVTDVNLGRGQPTGWDIARHARELDPDIPVVYMTGDSGHEWAANGVPGSILITKPFAPVQIVTAVSQLLNTVSPPAP
jgi:CheY-like chemotaxis protein